MNLRTLNLISLCALLFVSCEKKEDPVTDKPEPAVNLPEVTFSGFAVNDTLRNTVKAEFKISDTKALKSLEIFVNDSLLASSPGTNLSAEWNTLKVPDGNHTVKMVVTGNTGTKKETTARVVVNNALLVIEKLALVAATWTTSDYFITDSAGTLISKASFTANQTSQSNVRIYPTGQYSGKTINLIRVNRGTTRYPSIEYYIGFKRGEALEFKTSTLTNEFNDRSINVPVTLSNTPIHDHIILSTDISSISYPLAYGHNSVVSFHSKSKALIQVESGNNGFYNFFDITPGSKELKFDLSKVTRTSISKKVTLPSGIKDGYIRVYSRLKPQFTENYVVADKKFTGTSVNIFYPDSLKNPLYGTLQFSGNGFNYTQFHYTGIPDELPAPNFGFQPVGNKAANFEANMSGQFDHYRLIFTNKKYTDPNDMNYVELLVFGQPQNRRFSFPDLKTDFGIPGFDINSFNLTHVQFYKYDIRTDFKHQFNVFSTIYQLQGVKNLTIGSITY